MLLILPPSETKRDGGVEGSRLDPSALGYRSLLPQREAALAALRALCRDRAAAIAALSLGVTQQFEVDRNRALTVAPVMPALDRYTGVIYDAIDAQTLSEQARRFAAGHMVIGSALFGLVRADDLIPAYRLSHDSRLPGLGIARLWREAVAAELSQHQGLVLDLRSEAYRALGRVPSGEHSYYIRVVSEMADGRRIALSHVNKKAKGEFSRALIEAGIDHASVDPLLDWARGHGIRLEHGVAGELDLVV